jgi:hypothetical protein
LLATEIWVHSKILEIIPDLGVLEESNGELLSETDSSVSFLRN